MEGVSEGELRLEFVDSWLGLISVIGGTGSWEVVEFGESRLRGDWLASISACSLGIGFLFWMLQEVQNCW